MTKCVEIYVEDDGSMSVAVESDVDMSSPEEQGEQRQPVKSLDEVMQILQSVVADNEQAEPAPDAEGPADEAAAMQAGYQGVRGGGLNG